MKLASVTMIRHDGDIIEEFVRHTARFVDEVYIYDNCSLDSAAATLQSLQQEGIDINILPIDTMRGGPGAWHDTIIRDVWKKTDADYLVAIDADEFIGTADREALEHALQALPHGAHAFLPWVTYVPTILDVVDEPRTIARLRYRLGNEHEQFGKTIISREFINQPGARANLGAHTIEGAEMRTLSDSFLAHYPVRSIDQIQAKALLGWAMLVAWGMDQHVGYQWRRLYNELIRSPDWSYVHFLSMAQTYLSTAGGDTIGPEYLIYDPRAPIERRYFEPEKPLLELSFALSQQLAKTVYAFTEQLEISRSKLASPYPESKNSDPLSDAGSDHSVTGGKSLDRF